MTKKGNKAEAEPAILLRRRYSGRASEGFWALVNRCPNREIYTLGLILQEVESRVLDALYANQPTVFPERRKKRATR